MTTHFRSLITALVRLDLVVGLLFSFVVVPANAAGPADTAMESAPSGANPIAEPEPPPLRVRLAKRVEVALQRWGGWAPVAFIALFVLACILCVPTAFLTIAAGALFGVAWGLLYVWIGAQIGASVAFYISRHLARAWVMRRLAGHPVLLAIEEAVSVEGWKIVALSRLAPGSPFFILNYAFGLTRVRFWPYLLSTALCMVPGTFLFIYLGSLGNMALTGRSRSPWEWALYGAGLVAIGVSVALIARRAKAVLHRKLARRGGVPEGL